MKITVGDITLEADDLSELKELLAFVPEVREKAHALPVVGAAKVSTSASLGVGRFRRTREEIAANLSPEEALAKRLAGGGSVKASDFGATFSEGDEINLDEPPL